MKWWRKTKSLEIECLCLFYHHTIWSYHTWALPRTFRSFKVPKKFCTSDQATPIFSTLENHLKSEVMPLGLRVGLRYISKTKQTILTFWVLCFFQTKWILKHFCWSLLLPLLSLPRSLLSLTLTAVLSATRRMNQGPVGKSLGVPGKENCWRNSTSCCKTCHSTIWKSSKTSYQKTTSFKTSGCLNGVSMLHVYNKLSKSAVTYHSWYFW